MTSWRPLHPYTYSLDLGGAAAAGVLQEGWRQEAGAKGGASRLPLTFCLLTISGLYLGKFPQTPLHLLPTPTPSSDVGDVGGEASPGRLLSPASTRPVRRPRQRPLLNQWARRTSATRILQPAPSAARPNVFVSAAERSAAAGILQEEDDVGDVWIRLKV